MSCSVRHPFALRRWTSIARRRSPHRIGILHPKRRHEPGAGRVLRLVRNHWRRLHPLHPREKLWGRSYKNPVYWASYKRQTDGARRRLVRSLRRLGRRHRPTFRRHTRSNGCCRGRYAIQFPQVHCRRQSRRHRQRRTFYVPRLQIRQAPGSPDARDRSPYQRWDVDWIGRAAVGARCVDAVAPTSASQCGDSGSARRDAARPGFSDGIATSMLIVTRIHHSHLIASIGRAPAVFSPAVAVEGEAAGRALRDFVIYGDRGMAYAARAFFLFLFDIRLHFARDLGRRPGRRPRSRAKWSRMSNRNRKNARAAYAMPRSPYMTKSRSALPAASPSTATAGEKTAGTRPM